VRLTKPSRRLLETAPWGRLSSGLEPLLPWLARLDRSRFPRRPFLSRRGATVGARSLARARPTVVCFSHMSRRPRRRVFRLTKRPRPQADSGGCPVPSRQTSPWASMGRDRPNVVNGEKAATNARVALTVSTGRRLLDPLYKGRAAKMKHPDSAIFQVWATLASAIQRAVVKLRRLALRRATRPEVSFAF
jgi:hypothetical protein